MRLCGSATAVESARKKLGGDVLDDNGAFWSGLREHGHAFFKGDAPLWRLSLAPATPAMKLDGKWFYDWGGAQRWLRSSEPAEKIRATASRVGGHAMLYRGGDRGGEVFHPLPAALMTMHRNLKQALDPAGILNPGRMYKDL
jgi:glycolate oxidase FAD binding subunit